MMFEHRTTRRCLGRTPAWTLTGEVIKRLDAARPAAAPPKK